MWETRSAFHISMPHFLRQDLLWRRWLIAQQRMRPHRVVMHSPSSITTCSSFNELKNLALQTFIL